MSVISSYYFVLFTVAIMGTILIAALMQWRRMVLQRREEAQIAQEQLFRQQQAYAQVGIFISNPDTAEGVRIPNGTMYYNNTSNVAPATVLANSAAGGQPPPSGTSYPVAQLVSPSSVSPTGATGETPAAAVVYGQAAYLPNNSANKADKDKKIEKGKGSSTDQ